MPRKTVSRETQLIASLAVMSDERLQQVAEISRAILAERRAGVKPPAARKAKKIASGGTGNAIAAE